MTYQQLLQTLCEHSSQKYRDFNNPIVNSGVPSIGCTIPFVRSVAKQCSLEEAESFPLHAYLEVDLLRGIKVANCKLPFAEKSRHLSAFAQTIENWAVCDSACVKVPNSERELYFDFFCDMLSENSAFACRYGTVNLMSNFLDDEHVSLVFAKLGEITQWGEYYVDMGVAWLLATAMAKCRDVTVKFMEGAGRHTVGKNAYNKALQKMRDSLRVSETDKQWTRTMKID